MSAPGELEYVPIGTNQHMTSKKKVVAVAMCIGKLYSNTPVFQVVVGWRFSVISCLFLSGYV